MPGPLIGAIAAAGLGTGASIMMGGASLAMGAAGVGIGATQLAGSAVLGTVKLAKDSVQALSPIGAGGTQARKRLMERGLIESGVNRTKQLKRMAGKTAGLLGVNVSLASILKQSQIFTGVFGTVFQILGAFIDIMLIPLMPVIKWVLNNMIDFIPHVQAKADALEGFGKRAAAYLEDVKNNTEGVWGFVKQLLKDFWEKIVVPWWIGPNGWPTIKAGIQAVLQHFWEQTPWGKVKTPNEIMSEAIMSREVYDTPYSPDVFPKFGVPEPSLGFGAGMTDEFAEHGVPEGYPGGPPSASRGPQTMIENMQEVEANLQRSQNNIMDAIKMTPDLMKESISDMFGMGTGGQKAAAAQGLMDMGLSTGKDAVRGLIEIIGQGNMGLFPGNPIFDDQVGGSGTPYRGGFGELVTIGAVSNARSQSAAQAAIELTNQSKENYAAAYKDEASQYEDELYFQEMMLGVGRY